MPQINLTELAEQSFGTSLEQLDDRRIYKLLVKLVQERSATCPLNNGKKKLYYISAEFLIGKLLINNMIDLGIYDEVKDQLTAAGHDLNKIEEFEVEPSLGNGGLGRLAACFTLRHYLPCHKRTDKSGCSHTRSRSVVRHMKKHCSDRT